MILELAVLAVLWGGIVVAYVAERRHRRRAAGERVSWREMERLNGRRP